MRYKCLIGLLILVSIISACSSEKNTNEPASSEKNITEKTINLHIIANQSKIDGSAWDGFGGSTAGGVLRLGIPTSSPPDIMLCEIYEVGRKCYTREVEGNPYSNCHNSFDCSFKLSINTNKIVGLIVIDLDKKYHDLIDAALFVGSHIDPKTIVKKTAEWDKRLRIIANKMAAPFSKGELRRRERAFPVCYQQEGQCKLYQSSISWQ